MFLLQIVTDDGTPLRFHAGERVEMDLRKDIADALTSKLPALRDAILDLGVSFKTEAHVGADIDTVFADRFEPAIASAIAEALESFKAKATPWTVTT